MALEWGGKGKGLKWVEIVLNFWGGGGGGGCKAENGVGVIVANWLIGKVMTFEGLMAEWRRSLLLLGCSLRGNVLLLCIGW